MKACDVSSLEIARTQALGHRRSSSRAKLCLSAEFIIRCCRCSTQMLTRNQSNAFCSQGLASLIPSADEGPPPRSWIAQASLHQRRPLARSLTRKAFGVRDDSAKDDGVPNDYWSTGASESDPITGVLPGPRFVVINCSSASLKPG